MFFPLFLLHFFAFAGFCAEFKVLVVNDFHTFGAKREREPSCPSESPDKSCSNFDYPFGKTGLNPNFELMELIFGKMRQNNTVKEPDLLVLLGDFPAHPFAQDLTKPLNNGIYREMKNMIRKVTVEAQQSFPNTLILPVIGNNDLKISYQVPIYSEKREYYEFLWDLWFEQHQPNANLKEIEEVKTTFMAGGFYKIDRDNLRIIVLNTMYFARSNKELRDPKTTALQLKWFSKKMQEAKASNLQVLLIYHIFPGYCMADKIYYNFKENYARFFSKVLFQHRQNILLILSAHAHSSSFRFHSVETKRKSRRDPRKFAFYANTFISPAVSPVYRGNPGFSTVYFDKTVNLTKTEDFIYTHFDLWEFNRDQESGIHREIGDYWFNYSFRETYKVNDLSLVSVKKALQKVRQNLDLFKKHLLLSLGLRHEGNLDHIITLAFDRFGFLKRRDGGFRNWKVDQKGKCRYFCVMREIEESKFDRCLKKCEAIKDNKEN